MPEETIEAYQDHGSPSLRLDDWIDGARAVFEALQRADVSYEDVTDTLEREGVEKFSDSFAQLLASLEGKLQSLTSRESVSAR